MSRSVLDSSVLLAILKQEENSGALGRLVRESVVSSVNAAETVSKLVQWGAEDTRAWHEVQMLATEIVPFDAEQCRLAGVLVRTTQRLGLSLGDRACLALGRTLGLPVYTVDRAWSEVDAGVEVHVVR